MSGPLRLHTEVGLSFFASSVLTLGCLDHLEAAGHVCILKDAFDFENPSEISNFIKAENLEAAVALHLYRGGRLLQGNGIPFGIIFGGTDLNEDVNQGDKNKVMGKVLEEARFAVAFTESMKEMAQRQWPHAKDKIYVQSQGIATVPNTAFNWNTFLQCSEINQSADNLHLFLLICGLRQVKDPLYLVDAFSEWHQEEPNVYMVIVGPEVDPVFTREVKAKVKRTPGVRLIREMAQEDLHAVMKNCFAVVNSSVSEGMSAAILEAMDLEVPVLARNIPGNSAVVKHEVTGLLFSDPQRTLKNTVRQWTYIEWTGEKSHWREEGEEVEDSRAEGSSATGDGGPATTSPTPGVDGSGSSFLAGFNSIDPLVETI
ncbi:hypothetical protein FD755_018078 [Muntiacus reevesi]|uniref:Glycosyl transferase family 1 domain-containing protein n=1 Tax=Muntiacus reevesi TaxID=9886 RepID=A0A5N3XAD3_MUNRE|nr:hypothetical protein FD755_018078 [Muntiacus reevesi]